MAPLLRGAGACLLYTSSGSDSRIAVLENDIARNEESAAALREEMCIRDRCGTMQSALDELNTTKE